MSHTKTGAADKVANVKCMSVGMLLLAGVCLVAAFDAFPAFGEGLTPTRPAQPDVGETLYNGIQLPKQWPPRDNAKDRSVPRVPDLENPPAVIPIDVGRQLFVDDFLIEQTDLTRTFHHAKPYTNNPILKPETPLEMNGGRQPCATLFNDGVCFDPKDRLFKMWYMAGHRDGTAYATSTNGLDWVRPVLDVVPGSNRIFPAHDHATRDGSAVWLDQFASDPNQRFKMSLYERPDNIFNGQVFVSPDGIHWSGPTSTPSVGDNTTIFYNPFRKKWVYSVRVYPRGRGRAYRECDDLVQGAHWTQKELVPWACTDVLDKPDTNVVAMMPPLSEIKAEALKKGVKYEDLLLRYRRNYGDPPQLYNLDAVGYESLMLGVFTIHHGPENQICDQLKAPKYTDLELAFSRDGFHWDRPDRTYFLASTHRTNDWDRAYLHTAATICTVVGDKLYFYYGAWSGKSPVLTNDMYAGGAIGVAFLRREGFASMDAGGNEGTVTTRPVTFKGKHLFVNLDAPAGELRVEVLDENDQVIAPFTVDNCVAAATDSTREHIRWNGVEDLSSISGRKVKFRFHLRQGRLYAFWVTPDPNGASYGYVAAGGPEFHGPLDN